jgi:hypothetical protein
MFKKELYNDIPSVTVWQVLRKRLHLKANKLSIAQIVERWNTIVMRFLKHPVLPVEVTMYRNYPR